MIALENLEISKQEISAMHELVSDIHELEIRMLSVKILLNEVT